MNKSELVKAVAESTGQTQNEVRRTLDALLETTQRTVALGGKVSLPGFGTFESTDVPARTRRSPFNGEEYTSPATRRAKFKVGSQFKAVVAGEQIVPAP